MTYPSLSSDLISEITSHGIDIDYVTALIERAFAEDIGDGDRTSIAVIDARQRSTASLCARKAGVVAGVCLAAATFELAGVSEYQRLMKSGTRVEPGQKILTVTGDTRAILRAERVALNLISHLSGIATLTRAWVQAIEGTGAIIRDTRKTTPGLRQLEKFAVRMGGGMNHRMNLSDGAIIKDNHIAAAGSITAAVSRVREQFPTLEIEVEVDNLLQLEEALAQNVDVILLDNMDLAMTRAAVALAKSSPTKLESSGGLTLESAREYAETGVDFLAVGALTHSVPSLDIGLDF